MSVAIELMFVQESFEQCAPTPPHATNLQQLTIRLYSVVFTDARIPLDYACMLQSHVSVCRYVQCAAVTTFSLRHGSIGSSYSVVDISVAKTLRGNIPIGSWLFLRITLVSITFYWAESVSMAANLCTSAIPVLRFDVYTSVWSMRHYWLAAGTPCTASEGNCMILSSFPRGGWACFSI